MRKFTRIYARQSLRTLALAASCLSPFGAAAVQAQEAGANAGGLTDIVVTARRVEENLQDVPLSVSALGTDRLNDSLITRSNDLRAEIPNLVTTRTAAPGSTLMSIRGQLSGSLPNISLDPRIGIYLDGVYIARTQGGSFQIADIQRVEVLKGPQGTQFGKNVTGGSINFITQAPTGEFGVLAEAGIGNFGRQRYRATMNTPEMGGFSLRFTYMHDEFDGDVANLAAGTAFGPIVNNNAGFVRATRPAVSRLNARNTESMFAALRYDGGPITADLKFDYTSTFERTAGPQAQGYANTFVGCGAAALVFGIAFNCATVTPVASGGVNYTIPYSSAATNRTAISFNKLSAIAQDTNGGQILKSRGVSLTLAYDASDSLTLRSITGYRKLNTDTQSDNDGQGVSVFVTPAVPANGVLPYCVSCATQFQRQRQFSQEFQAIGNFGESIDYLLGLYFFRETGQSRNVFVANYNAVNPALPPLGLGTNLMPDRGFANGDDVTIASKARAIFGRVTVRPVENFDIVLGGRYTQDRKRNVLNPVLAGLVDDNPTLAGVQPVPLSRSVAFNKFTYDATAAYHFTDDVNVYVRYATAYVAGGLFRNLPFLPETTKSWEAGFKSEWFDRRLRFNAAAFMQKSKNLQVTTNAPPFGTLIVVNVGQLKTKGFEAELTAVPIEGLTLSGNIGHTTQRFSDGSRNNTPKWSSQVAASYDTPKFSNGMFVTLALDANYRSQYWGNRYALYSAQAGYNPNQPLPPIVYTSQGFTSQDAYIRALDAATASGGYWLANGRISLSDIPLGGVTARVSAYARNIFNVRRVVFSTNYGTQVGANFEEDRTYGLDLRISF